MESTMGLSASFALSEERQTLRTSLERYLAREAQAEGTREEAWSALYAEKSALAASEALRRSEAAQVERLEASAARRRSEAAALAVSKRQSDERKDAELASLGATLELSFAKLGAEESRVAAAREEARCAEDAASRRAREVAAAEADQRRAAEWLDDDQGHGEDAANHEVAVALDLKGQGILCDVRLRLRALEKPMRHLGSLAFLADASSHEEILLPVWPDVAHYDGFATNIAAPDPRPDPRTRNSLDGAKPLRMKRDYTHPPNWGHTV